MNSRSKPSYGWKEEKGRKELRRGDREGKYSRFGFGVAGLSGFVILYTSLAHGPPLPFLQAFDFPYFWYPTKVLAAAHQP